jgi:hypothetical protein
MAVKAFREITDCILPLGCREDPREDSRGENRRAQLQAGHRSPSERAVSRPSHMANRALADSRRRSMPAGVIVK